MLLGVLVSLCLMVGGPQKAAGAGQSAMAEGSDLTRNPEFWRTIAKNDYAVPAGMTAAALSRPLIEMLGSPDPEIRDEIAYTSLAQWIYQKRLLSDEDLRPVIAELLANLT
ncbi:MAG: hypothetical protein JOZ55_04835, partial [Alphaproteobacteria bacterium]|nr:hypothetical protein [Alphaproteobacteria bacterium]